MNELLKGIIEIAKLGAPTLAICAIIIVIFLNNKTEKKQLEIRQQELESYSQNNAKLIDKLELLTQSIIELVAKSDTNSHYHNSGIEKVEQQVVAIHERVNEIAKNQTEIRMKVDHCHKK